MARVGKTANTGLPDHSYSKPVTLDRTIHPVTASGTGKTDHDRQYSDIFQLYEDPDHLDIAADANSGHLTTLPTIRKKIFIHEQTSPY